MSENRKLTVLKGGKTNSKGRYLFHSAIGTKTRLMGVVALKLHWVGEDNHFVQWFLLDAEEHGIYDYISTKTASIEETDRYTGQFMGNLGGEAIPLTRKEAFFLIQRFAKDNKRFRKPLPRPEGYQFILKAFVNLKSEEIRRLNEKIFEEIVQPPQLINFFIMRTIAKDFEGMDYLLDYTHLSQKDISNYMPLKKAGVLLKNNIKNTIQQDQYITYTIVEVKGSYYRLKWRVTVTKTSGTYRIKDAKILRRQLIPPEEVAVEIQNPEYINLYRIKGNLEKIDQTLKDPAHQFIRYKFHQGIMYVAFHKNNNHVLRYLYHIGGDIKAIYFINHFNQLIACYYHQDDLEAIKDLLKDPLTDKEIELIETYEKKGSIIYEYAEAEEVDFFEYINSLTEDR
ncbi:hypothetical protein [Alkaliphilus transvaalensis]|uniref:hypothetical protein n=1 Tax=Alkaliphilus transvaalensis TaxID=114628 RepID=UPI00047BBA45|nr:hypothetical protein [Alkaliphilus transvaalensis]